MTGVSSRSTSLGDFAHPTTQIGCLCLSTLYREQRPQTSDRRRNAGVGDCFNDGSHRFVLRGGFFHERPHVLRGDVAADARGVDLGHHPDTAKLAGVPLATLAANAVMAEMKSLREGNHDAEHASARALSD